MSGPDPGRPAAQGLRGFLVRGGAFAAAGRLFSVAAVVLVHALVARLLPPDVVGRFFLVSSAVLVGRTIGGLGLGRILVRQLGVAAAREESVRPLVWRSIGVVSLAGALIGLLTISPFGSALLSWVGLSAPLHLRGMAALWILALVYEAVVVATLRGLGKVRLAVVFDGLLPSALLLIGLSGYGAVIGSALDLVGVVNVAMLSVAFSALLGLIMVERCTRDTPITAAATSTPAATRLVWLSLPILGSTLIAMVIDQFGLWLLGALTNDAEQLALYGTAQRLARFVILPLLVVNVVLPPIVVRLFEQGETPMLATLLRVSASVTFVVSAAVSAVLLAWSGSLSGGLFGQYYRAAAPLIGILALGHLIAVGCGSCGLMLTLTGRQRTLLAINVVTLLLLVCGGLLFRDSMNAYVMVWLVSGAIVFRRLVGLTAVRKHVGIWTCVVPSPVRVVALWRQLGALNAPGTWR